MRFWLLVLVLGSNSAFASLECVVDHSGRGIAKIEIAKDGAYVVATPYNSRVVVAARHWTFGDCAQKTCYALALGLVKSQRDAESFVAAWQGGWGTWHDVTQRLSPFTTALAGVIPMAFEKRDLGYGGTLTVNKNNSSWLGGRAYEEASLSCRAK